MRASRNEGLQVHSNMEMQINEFIRGERRVGTAWGVLRVFKVSETEELKCRQGPEDTPWRQPWGGKYGERKSQDQTPGGKKANLAHVWGK